MVSPELFYIGCYTREANGHGEGIARARRDPETGALRGASTVAVTPAPSFVIRHPRRDLLYAVNELDEGRVSAFAVDTADGDLTPLGSWPTGGASPCHLSLDPPADHLLVANYGGGSVASFTLDAAGVPLRRSDVVAHSGRSTHPERQEGPHAHTVAPIDGGILAVDLGVDAVFCYRLDPATGRLGQPEVAFRTPPGSGPRHLATDPSGRLHLVGELDATVNTYERGPAGWREAGRVPTSASDGAQPSEIAVSPDGRYLYVANRGPDTLAVFSLSNGVPERVGEVPSGGSWPRHFAISGEYLYVANQRSDAVVTFRLDPATGLPTPTGNVLSTPTPTCILPW